MTVHISAYEWDKLGSGDPVAGLTPEQWYKFFLAEGDVHNLQRLSEIYTPPPELAVRRLHVEALESQAQLVAVVTDTRIIERLRKRPDDMFSLTPRQFERFIAYLLEHLGYEEIHLGSGSKDGGVDISATIRHPLGIERLLVQCKRYAPDNKVGEAFIKQLYAEVTLRNAARGLVVTTSTFTRNAQALITSLSYRLSGLEYENIRRLLADANH